MIVCIAGFILTLVQLMLDVVLFCLILSAAQSFLGLLYHGVFSGPSFPNKLGTGIQLTLVTMILKVFMDIRLGKAVKEFLYEIHHLYLLCTIAHYMIVKLSSDHSLYLYL